ncbi:MAG TPA: hypothetical protein H9799_10080, partial [Candidatus Mediterraneibacter merdipullorum]|nr:hypothetical protein [Candidatus Mediterraneibacter merdipullorum]
HSIILPFFLSSEKLHKKQKAYSVRFAWTGCTFCFCALKMKKSGRKVYKEMKKRFTSVLLSLMLMIGLMPVTVFAAGPEGVWTDYAAEAFAGGTGTKDAPYLIETAEQLAKIAKDVNDGSNE